MTRVVVFACGEPLRGDDASAPVAVQGLSVAARARSDVRIRPARSAEDLLELEPHTAVVVVDAVTGPPSGTIVRQRLSELDRIAVAWVPVSGHQLPLGTTLGLARALGWQGDGTFLGIAAASFGLGEGLSEPVAAAVPALTAAVEREVGALGDG
jgi:hydrogenase maturation protease